jgi:predicted HTH domain antitoxin
MTIHFEIPKDIEERLRAAGIDLTQMAKEALLVDLYRTARITHHQLAEALGLNRYETDGVLKRHGVELELSLDEFNAEVASLREAKP